MATNGVNNLAFDGGSSRVRIHMSSFGGITKLSIPEEKLKQEKINQIGEQYATIVTPGIVEVGDGEMEMTSVGWKVLLGKLPDQFSDIEFPITTNQSHVRVAGRYGVILDRCGIISTKQEIEASEKANKVTIGLRVIMVLMLGQDGAWKTMARRPGVSPLASTAALALQF